MRRIPSVLIYIVACLLLVPVPSPSQNAGWTDYTSGAIVQSVAEEGNYVWAVGGGLARVDKSTLSKTTYTKGNSGLPDNDASSIAVDKNGTKWIGTSTAGVVRFDGTNWTVYNASNSGLKTDNISAITCDPSGRVWAGMWGYGLAVYDGSNWTTYTSSNSRLPDDYVNCIEVDSKRNIWIGTNSGLAKFDGTNWTVFTSQNSPITTMVRSVSEDKNGNIWVAVYQTAVAKYDGAKWVSYTSSSTGNFMLSDLELAVVDKNNVLWIACGGLGVSSYDGSSWRFPVAGLGDIRVNSIFVDAENRKWMATWEGLTRYDGGTVSTILLGNSGLSEDRIMSLGIDGSGTIWAGTDSRGVSAFNGSLWTVYTSKNSHLPDNHVRPLVIDEAGVKWFCTEGGLAKLDGTRWTIFTTSNSKLPSNALSAIAAESNGVKWIGTHSGLAKFDGSNWTVYTANNSQLPNDWVRAIAIDNSGNKWIGTDGGGLAKFDGHNWTVYWSADPNPGTNSVNAIYVDPKGYVWVGSKCRNVAKFDGELWTSYDFGFNCMAISGDKSGAIWVGGIFSGLTKFDGKNTVTYTITNSGLPNDNVEAIAVDNSGCVWVGTYGGGLASYRDAISLALTAPEAGAVWPSGSTQSISWTGWGIANVRVEYKAVSSSTWEVIAESAPFSQGGVQWKVPYLLASPIQVKISDASGSTGRTATSPDITILSASIEASTNFVLVGKSISFDGSKSTGAPASYRWEFNDGTSIQTGVKVSHSFSKEGDFPVNLTVTDSKGNSHTARTVVYVDDGKSDGLPQCKIDLLGGDVLADVINLAGRHRVLRGNEGKATLFIESRQTDDKPFIGYLFVKIPASVSPEYIDANGNIVGFAVSYRGSDKGLSTSRWPFYESEYVPGKLVWTDENGEHWYLFKFAPYPPTRNWLVDGLIGSGYNYQANLGIGLKVTGQTGQGKIEAFIARFLPHSIEKGMDIVGEQYADDLIFKLSGYIGLTPIGDLKSVVGELIKWSAGEAIKAIYSPYEYYGRVEKAYKYTMLVSTIVMAITGEIGVKSELGYDIIPPSEWDSDSRNSLAYTLHTNAESEVPHSESLSDFIIPHTGTLLINGQESKSFQVFEASKYYQVSATLTLDRLPALAYGDELIYRGWIKVPTGLTVASAMPGSGDNPVQISRQYNFSTLKEDRIIKPVWKVTNPNSYDITGYVDIQILGGAWNMPYLGMPTTGLKPFFTTEWISNTQYSPQNLVVWGQCPIQLIVTDSLGRAVSQGQASIPGSRYDEVDYFESGDPKVRVYIPDPVNGQYSVKVIPKANAQPSDTVTVSVVAGGKIQTVIENARICSLSTAAYNFVLGLPPARPPMLLSAPRVNIAGIQSFWVNWDKIPNASSYTLQISTDTGFVHLVFSDSTISDTSVLISTRIVTEGNYVLRLKASNTYGETGWSNLYALQIATTGVLVSDVLPSTFSLMANYPNPFNPTTTIRFSLPRRCHVNLSVFDALGQKVAELVNGDTKPGYHEVQFNAEHLSSGIYFYRLQAPDFTQTKKLCLIR